MTIRPKYMVLYHLFFHLCTISRPTARVLTDLFLLFVHEHSTKIFGSLSFNLSIVHDHSTKNEGPHWFISFMSTRPFDQIIWSSFIYSFFYAWLFDLELGSSLIYSFSCTRLFYKNIWSSFIYSLFFTRLFDQKLGPHWFISFICTWLSTKTYGPLSFIPSFVHDHSTKN